MNLFHSDKTYEDLLQDMQKDGYSQNYMKCVFILLASAATFMYLGTSNVLDAKSAGWKTIRTFIILLLLKLPVR